MRTNVHSQTLFAIFARHHILLFRAFEMGYAAACTVEIFADVPQHRGLWGRLAIEDEAVTAGATNRG